MKRAALLALVLPVLLTGCGGGSDKDAAAGPAPTGAGTSAPADKGPDKAADLCALVTAAEVAAITGYEVAVKAEPGTGCSYDSVKADARTEPSVGLSNILEVDGNGGFEGTKTGAAAASSGTAIDLPGVGDQAFTVTSGPSAPFNTCSAVAEVKGQVVTVVVTGGGSANRAKLAPVATALLKLAVSKV